MDASERPFETQAARRVYTFIDQSRTMNLALGCVVFAVVLVVMFFGGFLSFIGATRFVLLPGALAFLYYAYQYGWLEPISAIIGPDQRVAFRCAFRWRYVPVQDIRSLELKYRKAVLDSRSRERVLSINLGLGAVAVPWGGADARQLAEELSRLNTHIYIKEELLEELSKHDN